MREGEPSAATTASACVSSWIGPSCSSNHRTTLRRPGLVAQLGGVTVAVLAFEVSGDRITRIWTALNPDELRPWSTA